MQFWQHTHRFEAMDVRITRMRKHIEYVYHSGWRGMFSCLLFNPLALRLPFVYRGLVIRWALKRGPSP